MRSGEDRGARLRCALLGTPAFAVPALEALAAAGHEIAAVYTQPPRPSGRGHRLTACPVQVRAEAMGIEVRHPVRLRKAEAEWLAFEALGLDVAVVAAYGLILPGAMLAAPALGCLNIHASLLPRWRGAAPIQAAVLAGDQETGVTIMQMDEGLDTGAMLLGGRIPIGPLDDAAALSERLSVLGAGLVVRALAERPAAVAQPEAGATHAPKLTRADGWLDWNLGADALDRRVRGLAPWPGTATIWDGQVLKVIAARPVASEGTRGIGGAAVAAPGTVIDEALTVACGTGALRLTRVQIAGAAAQDAEAFLRGHRIGPGTRLGYGTPEAGLGYVKPGAGSGGVLR